MQLTRKENKKTGKANWLEIGVMFEGEKGLSGYLNSNPDVQVYLFEQQPKQQQGNYQQQNNYQQPQNNYSPQQQQPGDQSGFGAPPTDGVPF
jgi:hypothetical protein